MIISKCYYGSFRNNPIYQKSCNLNEKYGWSIWCYDGYVNRLKLVSIGNWFHLRKSEIAVKSLTCALD